MTARTGPDAATRTVTSGAQQRPVGLSEQEAARRLMTVGRNAIPPKPPTRVAVLVVRALREPLILVLLAAVLLTIVTGDLTDTAVIGLVVVVNTFIGVREQRRAEADIQALHDLVPQQAAVLRAEGERTVPVETVVPGDLVRLRAGDRVSADAVLVRGVDLRVDESVVTGESLDVAKHAVDDPGADPEPDYEPPESALVRSGTVVVMGRGVARVLTTGPASTVGRIASLAVATAPTSPLQRQMSRLSRQLAVLVTALSLVYMVVGLATGQPVRLVVLAAVALVVAAVPESLPLVVTLTLAAAGHRMARHRAVATSLEAVETLGAVTLLATDKTGTLTEGRLTVVELWVAPGATEEQLLTSGVLCNDARIDSRTGQPAGNPVDVALLAHARDRGVAVETVQAAERLEETPFDSTRKYMTTVHRAPTGLRVTTCKGAPEVLLASGPTPSGLVRTPAEWAEAWARSEALRLASAWAEAGRRVLAVTTATGLERPRLVGLVALGDPVRQQARTTVETCRRAGMRVVLVTGDHQGTAASVARAVGLHDDGATMSVVSLGGRTPTEDDAHASVIARARPEDKAELVRLWRASGEVVAMTGDGVNDAPALRHADIGVAMGGRGTDVARQAADLVLLDDHLETVVAAVEEGRRVFANLRRFLLYGLSGGGAELVLMLTGPLVGVPVPLLPAQILWVNLLTHSFAGAGLGLQPLDRGAMERPPRRPGQAVLGQGLWWRALVLAVWMGLASLAASLFVGGDEGRSVALVGLGVGQLAVAWGVRTRNRRDLGARRWRGLAASLLVAGVLLLCAVLVPGLRVFLDTVPLDLRSWLVAGAVPVATYAVARLVAVRQW